MQVDTEPAHARQEELIAVEIEEDAPFEAVELSVIVDGTAISVDRAKAEAGRYAVVREDGESDAKNVVREICTLADTLMEKAEALKDRNGRATDNPTHSDKRDGQARGFEQAAHHVQELAETVSNNE